MGTSESDAQLVGMAEGLLADGQRVWIARRGVEERIRVKNIFVDQDRIVRADIADTDKSILLAPGELAMIMTDAF